MFGGHRRAMREIIKRELKSAVELDSDPTRLSMLRLINTAISDKDKAVRGSGQTEGISDDIIRDVISTMIQQREESVTNYEENGWLDLAANERQEIDILTGLLPKPLSSEELELAVAKAIKVTGASQIRHKGRVMRNLKTHYPGQIDPHKVGEQVEARLFCHPD